MANLCTWKKLAWSPVPHHKQKSISHNWSQIKKVKVKSGKTIRRKSLWFLGKDGFLKQDISRQRIS